MAATPWEPSADEVRRIVAELRPVIDECVRRSRRELAAAFAAGAGQRGAA